MRVENCKKFNIIFRLGSTVKTVRKIKYFKKRGFKKCGN